MRQFVSEIGVRARGDEPGEIQGTHKQRLATVDGEYRAAARSPWRGQAQQIIDELGDGYMEAVPHRVAATPAGASSSSPTRWGGCRDQKESFSSKTGNEGQMVTWEPHITYQDERQEAAQKKLIEGA